MPHKHTPGADRDRKHESGPKEQRDDHAREENHPAATPSPGDKRGDQGEDARVSERDQRQGRRTKDATRIVGESGYASEETVPDR
jgi:hypothetical protein